MMDHLASETGSFAKVGYVPLESVSVGGRSWKLLLTAGRVNGLKRGARDLK